MGRKMKEVMSDERSGHDNVQHGALRCFGAFNQTAEPL